ncbi:polysaccharide deacetylase family protein [Chungangia koreensis]|uniref:Polysaccharide deacetylase family protein n=1 Tax=Chungangia koreensis TaxID=752657 RepID=A0ABV8X3M2_9LACT
MKKVYRVLFVMGMIFLLSMNFEHQVKGATLGTITLKSNAPAYHLIDGQKVGVATLLKGMSYKVAGEDEKNYHIVFGNDVLSVAKSSAVLSEDQVKIATINDISVATVITEKRTIVSHENKYIGFISKDVRVPVIEELKDTYVVNFGGLEGTVPKSDVKVDTGVPVLMYHHMVEGKMESPHASNRMVIDVEQFKEEMRYLKKNGWHTISLQELQQWLLGNVNLPAKTVVITFDDGITSTVKYAYPMLKDYGFKATSFTITGKIHQQAAPWDIKSFQYVGLKEIKETSDVFDYQHHAFYMHNLTPGTNMGQFVTKSYEEIYDDLEKGKTQLAKAFDHDTSNIKYLAYPFGHYNETTIQAAKAAGIEMAFTTKTGNVKMGDSFYELKRQGIAPEHTIKEFELKLLGEYK